MIWLRNVKIHICFFFQLLKSKWGITFDEKYSSKCLSEGEAWSDPFVECMAKVHTDPQNHQCGTAAIGLVIDPRLKVYNVDGEYKQVFIYFIDSLACSQIVR